MDKIKIVAGTSFTASSRSPAPRTRRCADDRLAADQDTLTLENMPLLADVTQLERILSNHGVDVAIAGKRAGETADSGAPSISPREIVDTTAPMSWSRGCGQLWCSRPCSRAWERRGCHCRAAAPSARGRSICC